MSETYDHLVKLVMIGNSGVGKTSILLRYTDDNFPKVHLTTIGIDFKMKLIDVSGTKVKVQIWDTAGQERFRTITQSYYKGAMGIIMVYDCTDESSFNSIRNWMQQINTHANKDVCTLLVGNKCDCIEERVVSTEQGQKLASGLGIDFVETSAKTSANIEEPFALIARDILAKRLGCTPGTRNSIRIVNRSKGKHGCCS